MWVPTHSLCRALSAAYCDRYAALPPLCCLLQQLADLEQAHGAGPGCDSSTSSSSTMPWSGTACSISLQGWMSCSKHEQLLAQHVAQHIDLQRLLQLAGAAAVPLPRAPLPPAPRTFRVSLGVAYDEAFYRYFQQ